MEARWGVLQAQASPPCLYKTALYVSGTGGKDADTNQDIFNDLLRLPTRNAHDTQKCKDTMEMFFQNSLKRIDWLGTRLLVLKKINENLVRLLTPPLQLRKSDMENNILTAWIIATREI